MPLPDALSPLIFSGRTFSARELRLIQEICGDFAGLGRTEISRTVCELVQWKRPNGTLKNHECRLLIERMEELGLVKLPVLRKVGGRGKRRVEVVRVLDRWRGEDHENVKLDGSDGARYIFRYDRSRDEWEIQMMESPPSTG